MKRMYLRWKKMGVEDKQKFERAIANQVDSQSQICCTGLNALTEMVST